MLSTIGSMLRCNWTNVRLCQNYVRSRFMHNLTSQTARVPCVSLNNVLKVNSCSILLVKPSPIIDPALKHISPPTLDLPCPFLNNIIPVDISNPVLQKEIKVPSLEKHEKQAARLIVIRRRKMKKHKLKKLRIRMKFEWAKIRQRREMRKEKLFQAKLIAQIAEGEKFDAAEYAADKLKKVEEFKKLQEMAKVKKKIVYNKW